MRNRIMVFHVVFFCFMSMLLFLPSVSYAQPAKPSITGGFVTRSGSRLLLGGQTFRFAGANTYWVGLDQNIFGVNYPTQFRVDDVFATAQEMGATVVRAHTLGISTGCSLCVEPSLGVFNQTALQHLDYAIMSAGAHGLRLIIPLTDNWRYYHGGKHNFTDWRGIADENQFYTNATVITDFEHYIDQLLNRVNSYTGVAYKNDPTILAWETGNELSAPSSWVQTIAAHIKSIDANHLVMDGNQSNSGSVPSYATDLTLSSVDMYTGHYYPMNVASLNGQAGQTQRANKVFVVGEYAWNNNGGGDPLPNFLSAIQSNSAISGDLFWSLFAHNDAYGYVQHADGYTLHYPGDTSDMSSRAQALRAHAYAMRGQSVPANGTPGVPVITNIGTYIQWRGTAVASKYSVERSTTGPNGIWTVICNQCATDNNTPWLDPARPAGQVWYRVRAYNLSGVSGGYSNMSSVGTSIQGPFRGQPLRMSNSF